MGGCAEGALIDLLIKFELSKLDRPFGEKRSVDRIDRQLDRVDVGEVQAAFGLAAASWPPS